MKSTILTGLLILGVAGALWAQDRDYSKHPGIGEHMSDAEKQKLELYKDKQALIQSNNQFAFDLYAKLSAQDGNLFCSPNSISAALAMTYAGARGQTEQQMAQALRFGLPQDRLHPAFSALIKESAPGKPEYYQLNIANALWGQTGWKILPEFLDLTNKNYGAGLNQLDFAQDTEKSRQTINDWVAQKTQGKIEDLLKPGVINPDTQFVLTNAIYFKGLWNLEFNEKATKEADFFLADGKKIKTQLMSLRLKSAYTRVEDFQMLKLHYQSRELSMLILLPNKPDGLVGCEKQLNPANLKKWSGQMTNQDVELSLPRFRMTCEYLLGETLAGLNMPDAFSKSKADFSGITGGKDFYISQVIHKAFVEVNEAGTEAAAATAVPMMPTGPAKEPEPPQVFRADHLFIFIIQDERTGAILFMGRLIKP